MSRLFHMGVPSQGDEGQSSDRKWSANNLIVFLHILILTTRLSKYSEKLTTLQKREEAPATLLTNASRVLQHNI